MNKTCWDFNNEAAKRLDRPQSVVDIGSLNVNGTVRDIWVTTPSYTGVDLIEGPGVDVVANGATYRPEKPVDLVVCNGVLEHTQFKQEICDNAFEMLRPGGAFILTVAGLDFPPHGILGGSQDEEYYVAMSQGDVKKALARFADVEIIEREGMVMALARKGAALPKAGRTRSKFLLVHPGAGWSTMDVWKGYARALDRAGVDVIHYALDKRIQYAGRFLDGLWRINRKENKNLERPTPVDSLYMAGTGILERALRHEVDWVLVVTGTFLLPDTYSLMRRAGLRVATMLTESPYEDVMETIIARLSNVCFTNERTSVQTFSPHCPTHYLPHSYDAQRHAYVQSAPIAADVPRHDVVFVGTGFEERLRLFEAVNWQDIDLGLYGAYDLWGSRNKMRRYIKAGTVDNAVTAALYRKAKIGLNLHRTSIGYGLNRKHVTGAESMNPRCYELAATGTFFITDARAEVKEVFGDLVPTFETPQELEDKIRYYLAHDGEREAIAQRLPGAVAGCTFDHRVRRVLEVLECHQPQGQ